MTEKITKTQMKFGIVLILILGVVLLSQCVQAGGNHHYHEINITNNYYNEPPDIIDSETNTNMVITNGISDADLAAGIAVAMAAGGHQFDYSTTDWQGSVIGVWQLSEEEENTASFAVGKRFNQMDALLHVTYTPNGSDDWVMVGGTFRF